MQEIVRHGSCPTRKLSDKTQPNDTRICRRTSVSDKFRLPRIHSEYPKQVRLISCLECNINFSLFVYRWVPVTSARPMCCSAPVRPLYILRTLVGKVGRWSSGRNFDCGAGDEESGFGEVAGWKSWPAFPRGRTWVFTRGYCPALTGHLLLKSRTSEKTDSIENISITASSKNVAFSVS